MSTEQIAAALYRMNGRAWYGHDLGDWDDPTSRIGRDEAERERWFTQARTLMSAMNGGGVGYDARDVS